MSDHRGNEDGRAEQVELDPELLAALRRVAAADLPISPDAKRALQWASDQGESKND